MAMRGVGMTSRTTQKWIFNCSKTIFLVAVFFIPIIGGISRIHLDGNEPRNPLYEAVVQHFHLWGWLWLGALALLSGGSELTSKLVGRPWRWRAVDEVLEQLNLHGFNYNCIDDPKHYHRATLFQRKQFRFRMVPSRNRWFWSGWLIPVARSGHATQNTRTAFMAPDNADFAEGVAGRAWATGGVVPVPGLPKLEKSSTPTTVSDYARKTWTSKTRVQEWLEEGKPLPTSMCAFPVNVRGKPWGVVVLDSRRGNGVKEYDQMKVAIELTQSLLGEILS